MTIFSLTLTSVILSIILYSGRCKVDCYFWRRIDERHEQDIYPELTEGIEESD